MICVKLQGGFGNQMFQYATAKSLALKNRCSVLLDLTFLEETKLLNSNSFTARQYELGLFKRIYASFADSEILKTFSENSKKSKWQQRFGLPYPKKYVESSMRYDENLFLQKPPVYLDGYWQSEQYFKQYREEIVKAFEFPEIDKHDLNSSLLHQIETSYSISVHVRRGDYLKPNVEQVHGVCSLDYYKRAIEIFQSKSPEAIFYFFSDDPEWVQENLIGESSNSILIQNNSGDDSWKDMYLMSKCKHHVIANSSFSWWAAWLNSSKEKVVIAPKRWFSNQEKNDQTRDLLPSTWIAL